MNPSAGRSARNRPRPGALRRFTDDERSALSAIPEDEALEVVPHAQGAQPSVLRLTSWSLLWLVPLLTIALLEDATSVMLLWPLIVLTIATYEVRHRKSRT